MCVSIGRQSSLRIHHTLAVNRRICINARLIGRAQKPRCIFGQSELVAIGLHHQGQDARDKRGRIAGAITKAVSTAGLRKNSVCAIAGGDPARGCKTVTAGCAAMIGLTPYRAVRT